MGEAVGSATKYSLLIFSSFLVMNMPSAFNTRIMKINCGQYKRNTLVPKQIWFSYKNLPFFSHAPCHRDG